MSLARRQTSPVRNRRWLYAVAGCLIVTGLVAAAVWFGHSSNATSGRQGGQPEHTATNDDEDQAPTAPPPAALVAIRTVAGQAVMADGAGFTLYTFSADSAQVSRCTGECARRWRPFTSAGGKPQAGTGAALGQVGSIQRADGTFQVTYNGWPLYHFVGDTQPAAQDGAGRKEYGGSFNPAPPTANHA
jgi:predicted lipoprotein with Yx(FWY)xxD motif